MTIHPVKRVPFNDNEFPETDGRPVVMFVGIEAPTFSSAFMIEGFGQAGYRVEYLDWQKVKFNDGITMLQSLLIAKATTDKPDLIFLHIQTEGILNTAIVSQLNDIAPTVIYNFDCRLEEQMKWLYDLVPYVSLVCFSNLEDVQNCAKLGHHNTAVLKSSADFNHYERLKNTAQLKEMYPHEIVFIGNRFDNTNMKFPLAQERKDMVDFLQKEYGDRFKAWGIGFSRMVNQQEERNIYSCAKIAIAHNNFYRPSYCSDRTFRAMGCGAFTIQKHYPQMNLDFNNRVTSTWLDFEGLKYEIDKHLEDEELRESKAVAGASYVREVHSWYNRVIELRGLLEISKDKKLVMPKTFTKKKMKSMSIKNAMRGDSVLDFYVPPFVVQAYIKNNKIIRKWHDGQFRYKLVTVFK